MRKEILTNKVEREHLSGDIDALEQERQGIIGVMAVSKRRAVLTPADPILT